MAEARIFDKRALVCGVLSSAEERRSELLELLEQYFGPIASVGPVMDFSYTDYYDSEMGKRPVRYLIMFQNLVDPSQLAEIKTTTNLLEKQFLCPSGRTVNLDPGILSLSNFILATCKDRSHRIPLSNGIFAETTLIYQNHGFETLAWTYADYRSEEIRTLLCSYRQLFKQILKK